MPYFLLVIGVIVYIWRHRDEIGNRYKTGDNAPKTSPVDDLPIPESYELPDEVMASSNMPYSFSTATPYPTAQPSFVGGGNGSSVGNGSGVAEPFSAGPYSSAGSAPPYLYGYVLPGERAAYMPSYHAPANTPATTPNFPDPPSHVSWT